MTGETHFAVDSPAFAVASMVIPLEPGGDIPSHSHPQHQLTWAPDGPLTVTVDNLRWVVQRSRALWIPGGVDHGVVPGSSTSMLSLYFEPDDCPLRWSAPTVVDATGLMGPLLSHLVELGAGSADHRVRATAVLWDLMKPLSIATIPTILPTDPLALRIALAIKEDPADPRDLEDWGREVGASPRTLSRRFRAETGVSFSSWRTNERLNAALPLLGMGQPVARVARAVGYQNASAFITAFRREVGTTPAAYFRGSGAPSVITQTPAQDPGPDPASPPASAPTPTAGG
ncbi:helix-turn-helix transcriptional regulator [Streptomyces sp. NBC_01304]|uniref:helix-turn-helix transcriptional regulator n=1 Tax=Streptomyces sp. NBC_01304 TaxID=2903818 RepID=UPI002E148064|nr:helix-turn-helix transcriptional regulator [Streptomyces sp. NBC_01304]